MYIVACASTESALSCRACQVMTLIGIANKKVPRKIWIDLELKLMRAGAHIWNAEGERNLRYWLN